MQGLPFESGYLYERKDGNYTEYRNSPLVTEQKGFGMGNNVSPTLLPYHFQPTAYLETEKKVVGDIFLATNTYFMNPNGMTPVNNGYSGISFNLSTICVSNNTIARYRIEVPVDDFIKLFDKII